MTATEDLALLGAENLALDADDVADVELLVALVYVFADVVALDIELKAAVAVGHVREGRLAHDALRHHAACEADGLALELVKMLVDVAGIVIALEANLLERSLPAACSSASFSRRALELVQLLCGRSCCSCA